MATAPLPGLVYACLTHIPLWIDFPDFVTPIYLGTAQGEGRLNLRDLAPEWVRHHPVLGGVAGSFALKRYVQQHHPDATRIGICQYRKFITRERAKRAPAPNYPLMDMVPLDDLRGGELARRMHPGAQPFLVSRPYAFYKGSRRRGSILAQYAAAHHIDDLLRFITAAVELKVLDEKEVEGFLLEFQFIPGGIELGVYEAAFWLRSIDAVERVVAACLAQWPAHRADPYQARAWAFCAERLGSWLLLKEFKRLDGGRRNWPLRPLPSTRMLGYMNLITDNPEQGYTLGSVAS